VASHGESADFDPILTPRKGNAASSLREAVLARRQGRNVAAGPKLEEPRQK